MYDIMIVDDEQIIREGLINAIAWNKYGYNITAQAENGKKALEIAKKVKPHMILTDIYMPVMDGIDFAKKIKEELPETVVIFLSGYDEFTYAQKAIEIGIFRYLTKPISEKELLMVLKEAEKDLEHHELEQAQINKLKQLIQESLPLLKERFLLNLVKGELHEKEITDKLEYLGITISADHFLCMVLSLDDYFSFIEKKSEDDTNLIKFAVQNITEEILSELHETFFTFVEKQNEIGILFGFASEKYSNYVSVLHPLLQKIQDSVKRYLGTTISVGIGRSCSSLTKLCISYKEAQNALEYKAAFGKNSIIYIGDIEPSEKYVFSLSATEKSNELTNAVRNGNVQDSLQIMDEILEAFKSENSLNKDHMHLFVIEIISKLVSLVLEFNGNVKEVYGEKITSLTLFHFDTIEDIRLGMQDLLTDTVHFISAKRKAFNKNFIEKAKEFIHQNYTMEGLNLNTIADSVHVSPGYLSQLFKQVVGESCIEYLCKVRMNQAKKLLKETNLKAYEIAYKVGFNDSHYFSTCFKKYVGVPPTHYRDMITKDIFEEE